MKKLPCENLPSIWHAKITLSQHADIRKEVEKLTVGNLWLDSSRCQGKAEIIIYYATKHQRVKIKALIGSTFFGIPYRMFNV